MMSPFLRRLCSLCLLAGLLGMLGCRNAAKPYPKPLLGGIETTETELAGTSPQKIPGRVYVADFALAAENFHGDQGVRGALPGGIGQGAPRGLGERLPHPFASGDPAERSREIVDTMARSLIGALQKEGIPAARIHSVAGSLPTSGWLLQGVFTEVGEGNRIQRAVIGFGRGASTMELQIGISDLAGAHPKEAFMVFGTVKDPSKLPGAAVTMNPYVAAAKFVMEKNATDRDIRHTAEQIVHEILKYEQQIKQRAALQKRESQSP